MASFFVYAALVAALAGALCVLRPPRRLGVTRGKAGLLVLGGLVFAFAVLRLPVTERRVGARNSALDEFLPAWHFAERHQTLVAAPRTVVYAAIKAVTADEIALYHTLTAIRRFGRSGPENVLNAPGQQPILATMTRGGFQLLADEPAREIVFSAVMHAPGVRPRQGVAFREWNDPGLAKIAMNFRMEDNAAGGTLLTTETRVYATDQRMQRGFAGYWRIIYPGSSLIRVMWLRAIRLRAERTARAGSVDSDD